MNTHKLPRDQVAGLRAEDLQLYLDSRGWHPDSDASSELATVYRLPAEPDAEILVPRTRHISDYVHRMADAAQMLAAVEQRCIWEVLTDLASPPADILRLRVQSPDSTSGTLPLEEGLHLIQGGRDLLLAAACSAQQVQAYFPRQSFAAASEFLRTCRLAQTEQGSFVARFIIPVPPAIAPSLFDEQEDEIPPDEPYERRVTLFLMAALQTIQSALTSGRPEDILQGVSRGVSANLCDALAAMTPGNPQASLEVSMSWSRSRPRAARHAQGRVALGQGQFTVIRAAGRRLREGLEPRRERITGLLIGLQAEPPQFLSPFHGRVIARAEVEGRSSRVRFVLSQIDYARACDAHRDRRRITVTGVLQRDAHWRTFDLLRPRDFGVLPEERADSATG